ncbi:mTERF [Seminavis robusta]|uniref:mTERF n=1 Tax=Seminavis robusta TaxID=568900 RepID=A0A9N8EJA2_9STRA|nr:mTERF [Seminavis robusta]|eukprot:Sro1270_g257920.1 mTERF (640) ;mRNA; r:5871-8004
MHRMNGSPRCSSPLHAGILLVLLIAVSPISVVLAFLESSSISNSLFRQIPTSSQLFLPQIIIKRSVIVVQVSSNDDNIDNQSGEEEQEESQVLLVATKKRNNVNQRVRSIVQVLSDYNGQPRLGPQWSKTKNYLYNQRDLTDDQVGKVLHFLNDVLKDDIDLVCSVIQSNPRILRKSVDHYLIPTAQFLQNLYGSELFCEAVRRNPGILLSTGVGHNAPDDAVAAMEELLTQRLGRQPRDITALKKKAPWLFQTSVEQITSVLHYLDHLLLQQQQQQQQHQQNHDDPSSASEHEDPIISEHRRKTMLGKLIQAYPTIFHLSVETNLKPKVAFLQQQCGFTNADVASLLTSTTRAGLFCLSLHDNLQPTLELLQELFRDDDNSHALLRDCILKHPQILSLSQANLQEKIAYFDRMDDDDELQQNANAGQSQKDSLACRIAIRSPTIFSLSLNENIQPKVDFLANVWGINANHDAPHDASTTKPSLTALLGEYPNILTLSLEGNIQPTLNFYNQTGYIKLDSDWNWEPSDPEEDGDKKENPSPLIRARYIACSLFQRLLPRWHFYLKIKVKRSKTQFPVEEDDDNDAPPLHILAMASDAKFCDFLGAEEEEYKAFKEETIPRLKFSSQFDTWLKTGRPIDV